MGEISDIIKNLKQFKDDREWSQFHNSKDLAISINLEASELLELFLWKDNEAFDQEKLKEELADVLICALFLAEKHNLDVKEIIKNKMQKNAKKYPIEKSKGNCKKYTEF